MAPKFLQNGIQNNNRNKQQYQLQQISQAIIKNGSLNKSQFSSLTLIIWKNHQMDQQSMNIQMFGRHLLVKLVTILVFAQICSSKCQNTTEFRYELRDPAEIVNYNSLCFEYSKRTCCSPNNLDTLSKKIAKMLGPSTELSIPCRRRLTALMCSSCDGDVGQSLFQGVCGDYCIRLFEECRNDLFSIDANNQLKVCRDEDIICSSLESIVAERGEGYTCGLFDHKLSNRSCWNGQISARLRGKALRKITINPKKAPQKKQKQSEPWIETSTLVYLLLTALLTSILVYQYSIRWYRSWKRQIRNIK